MRLPWPLARWRRAFFSGAVVLLFCQVALAAAAPLSDEALLEQLGRALEPAPPAPPQPRLWQVPAGPGPEVMGATPLAVPSPLRGGTGSGLNLDISVILDGAMGWQNGAPARLAGDDPDLGALATRGADASFTLQEVELAVQSVVDPYLRADLYLTIANLGGVEVEEAFATTTGLPAGLQIKAGVFRSALGRQNGQHLHEQLFTRRPLLNAAYLAADGLRAPGVQLSVLLPTPFYLLWVGEAFSVAPPDTMSDLSTFGGATTVAQATYTTALKTFAPITENLALSFGLNAAAGRTAGITQATPPPATGESDGATTTNTYYAGARTLLTGADLYVKWKRPNVANGFFSVAWQTEYFVRRTAADAAQGQRHQLDAGLYSQLLCQLARRWTAGVRWDGLGFPSSDLQRRTTRSSLSLTFAPSEYARLRLYGEREKGALNLYAQGFSAGAAPFGSTSGAALPARYAAYIQLEVSMGAHGAHAY